MWWYMETYKLSHMVLDKWWCNYYEPLKRQKKAVLLS